MTSRFRNTEGGEMKAVHSLRKADAPAIMHEDAHYRNTDELLSMHAENVQQIHAALEAYAAVPREKYFYELCFCLMTPQSSASHAADAQTRLEELQFLTSDIDPEPILRRKDFYIRFHRTKSKRLIKAKAVFPELMSVIAGSLPAFEKREWLVGNIDGLSYKEATHFLRNIGMNGGLAILDVHIQRCLLKHGVIDMIPEALTRARYFMIEALFQEFAASISIPIDELDLVFWSGATGFILK